MKSLMGSLNKNVIGILFSFSLPLIKSLLSPLNKVDYFLVLFSVKIRVLGIVMMPLFGGLIVISN